MGVSQVSPEDRCVILHADDFGMCHTTNQAILQLLDEGAISATTLMVNCPWSLEAAMAVSGNPAYDVGIHLTLTSEWEKYKWGPIGRNGNVSTLVNSYGHFPAETAVVAQADPEQIRQELIAQIETALKMGVDPTHLDNHMGSLIPFMELFVDISAAYRLPFRFGKRKVPSDREEEIAERARQQGVLHPDRLVGLPFWLKDGEDYETTKRNAIELLKGLEPGITELIFHPSLDTEELKAITNTWPFRRYEFDVFRDPDVQETIRREKIKVIGWRELRERQRSQLG